MYRTQRVKGSQPATKRRRNEGMKIWCTYEYDV
jgi:hypothetical protein